MLINFLFKLLPLRCTLCLLPLQKNNNTPLLPWCKSCEQSLPREARCLRCGLPTAEDVESCGRCLQNPPLWQSLRCVDSYQFPYDKLLHRFKYQKQFWHARNLVDLLAKEITNPAPMIIPVPMHWKRQIIRGYNQSHVLAMLLAKKFNRPCSASALIRTKATKQQQGLNKKQRSINLRNAFSLTEPLPDHIALVDDVVTTGSTINEICKLLKHNNVKHIDVYCIARSTGE